MIKRYHRSFSDYLSVIRVSKKTKEAYLRSVAALSAFHDLPAANLSNNQIQDFLLYSIQEKALAWSSCNVLFCGLKKFYQDYLGRSDSEFSIPPRTRSKQLPMLLSKKEVLALIKVQPNIKHRALLATVYGSGLRVSEVVKLTPEHIDSSRMMIRVEQGKGRKDRYTVLSQNCLDLLREYWRMKLPEKWLFYGQKKELPMSIGTAQHIYYQAKDKTKITKGRGIHTLRHCFATHSFDSGTEIYVIKRWMGHTSIRTTYKYIHLTPGYLRKIQSPLDMIDLGQES